MARSDKPQLSTLENSVMRVIWDRAWATAEDVRTDLSVTQPLKDSTVRTILRRLEEKGYVRHTSAGRAFVYWPKVAPGSVAAQAVRGIIERFCQGSVEDLLVGMVDDEIVSPHKLRQLAERIGRAESAGKRKGSTKRG